MSEPAEKQPKYFLLKALIFPVLVVPALVVTLLVIRGNEAEQLYYRGLDAADRGDFIEAARNFERASNLGHGNSAYNLALLYREGLLEAPNRQKLAMDFLRKAADNGSLDAEYELGKIAETSTPPNYDQAAMHYDKAARGGHTEGMLALGRLYEAGLGVNQSPLVAAGFYEKAAAKGNADAALHLGALHLSGKLGSKDAVLAEQYLLTAAEKNHPQACNMLGYFYEQRSNSDSDRKLSGKFYGKAAQLNDPDGLINYGDYLFNSGQQNQALVFYQQAEKQHNSIAALHRIGMYYYKQPEPDYANAQVYFERAAQRGNAASWINLGIMAEKGLGRPVDLEYARKCYSAAAEKGHAEGKKLLEKLSGK